MTPVLAALAVMGVTVRAGRTGSRVRGERSAVVDEGVAR